jgi:hypothetical protein
MRDMKGRSLLDKWYVWSILLLVLLSSVVILWRALPAYLSSSLPDLPHTDLYDAVSGLFTGLAFAGLLFTIFLQQRQIKLQREDFLSQLQEMQLSRAEVANQVRNQEKHLLLGVAELKMKSLEVKIVELELKTQIGGVFVRSDHILPELKRVKEEMDSIIRALEQELQA